LGEAFLLQKSGILSRSTAPSSSTPKFAFENVEPAASVKTMTVETTQDLIDCPLPPESFLFKVGSALPQQACRVLFLSPCRELRGRVPIFAGGDLKPFAPRECLL
jgi:hypothetical protein